MKVQYLIGHSKNLTQCNLHGLDISNMELSGEELLLLNLRNVRVNRSQLETILAYVRVNPDKRNILQGVNLSYLDLSKLDLSRLNLSLTNLTQTILNDAEISFTEFHGSVGLTKKQLLRTKGYKDAYLEDELTITKIDKIKSFINFFKKK